MDKEKNAEIYKFIRDRYDKLLMARSMAQTRLGHLLVFAGFLITGLTSAGLQHLIPAFSVTHTAKTCLLTSATTFAFATTFASLGALIYQLFGAAKRYTLPIPAADPEVIFREMSSEGLSCEQTYVELANLYLPISNDLKEDSLTVGQFLDRAFTYLGLTLALSGIFLAFLVWTRFAIGPVQ